MHMTEGRTPGQLARLLLELNFSSHLTTYTGGSRAVKQMIKQGSLEEDEGGLLRGADSFRAAK